MGESTTSAVVISLVLIFVFDFALRWGGETVPLLESRLLCRWLLLGAAVRRFANEQARRSVRWAAWWLQAGAMPSSWLPLLLAVLCNVFACTFPAHA